MKLKFILRPNETVRREIVAELFIQLIHSYKVKSEVPYMNTMLEVFYREASASVTSKQTPEELRKTMHQGTFIKILFQRGVYSPTGIFKYIKTLSKTTEQKIVKTKFGPTLEVLSFNLLHIF